MVDRKARNLLAEQIRHFVAGLSDNFEFDDVVFAIKTDDLAVREIRKQLWHTYDDFSRHRLRGKWALSDRDTEIIKRIVLFLKTDHECSQPDKHTDWDLWPFDSGEQFATALCSPVYFNTTT